MRISSSSLFLVTYHSAAVQKSHERTFCFSAVDIFLFLSAGDGFACGDIVPSRSRHNRRGNTLPSSNTNHSVFSTRTTQANKISPWPRRQRMALAEYRESTSSVCDGHGGVFQWGGREVVRAKIQSRAQTEGKWRHRINSLFKI